MIRSAVVVSIAMALMTPACSRGKPATGGEPGDVTVNLASRHQTIEGWGTSMIFWSLPNTPHQDKTWREAYRDLGLNILRLNINKEVLVDASGDMAVPVQLGTELKSNIVKMDFSNTKTKVYGEMAAWLRKNALEPDRVKITGSVWSPPHWMKGPTGTSQYHVTDPSVKKPTPWLSEGTRGDSIGGRLLQTPENREQFGRYLAAWIKGFEQHYGVPIYAASIQNELSFENPFDSATYATGPDGKGEQWWQYAEALASVKKELTRQRVSTKIMGPHMAQVGETPNDPWGLWHQMNYIKAVKAHRDSGLLGFLSMYNSNGYLGTSEDAVKMWAGYFRGKRAVPADWARWIKAPGVEADGKPIWVSEVGGIEGSWLAGKDGTPGKGTISVAQKMHNALVHANASAYVYWLMSDTDDEENGHTLLGKKHIGNPTESKKYAAFKHFSRYIRPGAVRVGASFANGKSSTGAKSEYDTLNGLNVSAYLHEADRTITVVLVNMKATDQPVSARLPDVLSVGTLEVHLTSSHESFAKKNDLAIAGGKFSLTAPAHTVMTLHGKTGRSP